MATIERSIEIAAPIEAVFNYVADYRDSLNWMVGFSKFSPVSPDSYGLGAKVRAEGRMFGIPAATTLEIVEFDPPNRLVSLSEGMVRSRSIWSFEKARPRERNGKTVEGTIVAFIGEYRLVGLPVPAFAEKLIWEEVANHVTQSLKKLRQILEEQELRKSF